MRGWTCIHFHSFRQVHRQPSAPTTHSKISLWNFTDIIPAVKQFTFCMAYFNIHIGKMPAISLIYHAFLQFKEIIYILSLKCSSKMPIMLEESVCLLVGPTGRLFFFPVPGNNSALNTTETLHPPRRRNSQKYHPQTSTNVQQCHCPKEVTPAISARRFQKCHWPLCSQGQRTHRFPQYTKKLLILSLKSLKQKSYGFPIQKYLVHYSAAAHSVMA